MNPGPYEDETGDEDRAETRRSGLVAMVVGVAALVGFGGAMWYAYDLGVKSGGDGAVPVISAPEGPAKRRPVEEGGIEVPFQDKLVYERFNSPAPGAEQAERLLPPPETPMAPPPAPVEPQVSVPALATPDGPSSAPLRTEPQPVPAPVEAPAAGQAGGAPAAPAAKPPEAAPPSAAAPPAAAPPAAVEAAGDAIRVQLASVRSDDDARTTWERLRKAHADLLGKLSLHVDRVDLGAGKGVYYRVQAGPVSESNLAQLLCGQLKSRGLECFVVK